MTDTLRKIAEAATQILADVRAGNHPHGDIRDAGRVLTGKWDQDFPTAVLELAASTIPLLQWIIEAEKVLGPFAEYAAASGRHPGDTRVLLGSGAALVRQGDFRAARDLLSILQEIKGVGRG